MRIKQELDLLVPLNIGVASTPTLPQPARDLLTQAKVNFNFTPDHSFFVRYSGSTAISTTASAVSGSAMLDYATGWSATQQKLLNGSAGWNWILEPLGSSTSSPRSSSPGRTTTSIPIARWRKAASSQRLTFPIGVDRPGVGRRLPALVQLRGQVAVPERHVDPDRTPCVQIRRRLRTYLPKHGGIYGPGSPGAHQLLPRSVGDPQQLERPLSAGPPDARHRAVDHHHRDADRRLRLVRQLDVQQLRAGRLADRRRG